MDRFGIRLTMTGVVVLFGCACFFTSQVTGLVTLFLAFFTLRLLGQGALSLLASNTLAMWFHVKLGRVSGVTSVGMAGAVADTAFLDWHYPFVPKSVVVNSEVG